MKVKIEKDELYPVYFIHENWGVLVDLMPEEMEIVRRGWDGWHEAQELLARKAEERE